MPATGETLITWERRYPWAYHSSFKGGWICKVCEEYSTTGGPHWKTVARVHDEHPSEMFNGHVNSNEHQQALHNKSLRKAMLAKGSVKAQITSGAENSAIEVRERNRRVIMKLIKTVYFMAQKKWAVKNNFKDVVEFVKDLGDANLEKHFRDMGKNATYLSTTSVDEFVCIISDFIEKKFLSNVLLSEDFALLTDESTDEAGRAQMSVFVQYMDMSTNSPKEEFLCICKLGTSKASEALMKELEQMFEEKHIAKENIRFSGLDGTMR